MTIIIYTFTVLSDKTYINKPLIFKCKNEKTVENKRDLIIKNIFTYDTL